MDDKHNRHFDVEEEVDIASHIHDIYDVTTEGAIENTSLKVKRLEELVFEYKKSKEKSVFGAIDYIVFPLVDKVETKITDYNEKNNSQSFHKLDFREIVNRTLKERIEAYAPETSDSTFLGYLKNTFEDYCKTNVRKEITKLKDPSQRPTNKTGFNNYNSVLRFKELLSTLPPRQKDVLYDYCMKGHTYQKIASDLKITPSTVRTTKSKALEKIKELDPKIYKMILKKDGKE